jgi:hypothetical protein
MSNYYKSNCCGKQVIEGYNADNTLTNPVIYFCRKCGKKCEVIAMLDIPNGVPKEEKCVIGNHDNCTSPFCPCYPDEDIKKIRLNQLKDEMENEYKKLIVSRGIEISAQGIFVIRDFLSSHLQKTYEVAEKAGYERGLKNCKAIIEEYFKGLVSIPYPPATKIKLLRQIDLLADLSTSDTK